MHCRHITPSRRLPRWVTDHQVPLTQSEALPGRVSGDARARLPCRAAFPARRHLGLGPLSRATWGLRGVPACRGRLKQGAFSGAAAAGAGTALTPAGEGRGPPVQGQGGGWEGWAASGGPHLPGRPLSVGSARSGTSPARSCCPWPPSPPGQQRGRLSRQTPSSLRCAHMRLLVHSLDKHPRIVPGAVSRARCWGAAMNRRHRLCSQRRQRSHCRAHADVQALGVGTATGLDCARAGPLRTGRTSGRSPCCRRAEGQHGGLEVPEGEVRQRAPGCPPGPSVRAKVPFSFTVEMPVRHFAPECLTDNHLPHSERVILVNVASKPADLPSTHPPQSLLLSPGLLSRPVPSWVWHTEFRDPRPRCRC